MPVGTSNAFQVSPAGFKNDGGSPVYYYSIALSSQEGKDNLLAYKWKADDLIFKCCVEFREETLGERFTALFVTLMTVGGSGLPGKKV